AFRAHPQLLFEDLRILAIDFDPQASLTMFLSHENSVGLVENTAAQAMLQNVSREELLSDFIVPSIIPGVDVIPASIDDAFLAEGWKGLCE
ncbi:AAA family ATPase, partial [Klebsiella pneumoniae]|nr:AAA family ATPase [Klebsiella pneumoniae]